MECTLRHRSYGLPHWSCRHRWTRGNSWQSLFPSRVNTQYTSTRTSDKTSTVVPGFSVLGFRALPGFRALCTGNQIWIYVINLPGFSALPGFKAPFHGDGQSALNPGTTVHIFSWFCLNFVTTKTKQNIDHYLVDYVIVQNFILVLKSSTVVPGFSALCPSP